MGSYADTLDLALPADTAAGQQRQQILDGTSWDPTPTSTVTYAATNRLLIIGDADVAARIEAQLADSIVTYIAVPGESSGIHPRANAHRCADLAVSGHLGRFAALFDGENLAGLFGLSSGLFDQVLDLGEVPRIDAAVKPPGYHHAPLDGPERDAAVAAIPELIGEFEKPKYFDYRADICAHGRSGIAGCRKCLDVCPTDAIQSLIERIEVDPYLCQGGGSCTAACPTGAITYRYPEPGEQIDLLRRLLGALREALPDRGISLLVFDNEHGRETVAAASTDLPDHVLPFVVEELGSAGLDLIAAALAYGADRVYLLETADTPRQVISALEHNIDVVQAVLDQTGHDDYRVRLISDPANLDHGEEERTVSRVATFAPVGDKRTLIRNALSFFAPADAGGTPAVGLPDGAMFGRTVLDSSACTLCMGCVSVCPGGALQAGGESPALRLIEANCVQCGICTRACPESAMTLEPRLHFNLEVVNRPAVLKEEAPFHCVSCDKPFATQAMISRMTEKLEGHWMFSDPVALRRLKMCEDCRVRDLFEQEDRAS